MQSLRLHPVIRNDEDPDHTEQRRIITTSHDVYSQSMYEYNFKARIPLSYTILSCYVPFLRFPEL